MESAPGATLFERRWVADLALLLVVMVWGLTFPMIKGATETAPVFGFLTLRFAIALLGFVPLLRFRTRREIPLSAHLGPGIAGGVALFLCYALQTFGLRETTSTMSAFLTGTSVVMVPLGAALWLRQRLHVSEGIGLALVVGGLPCLCGIALGDLVLGRGEALTLGCAGAVAVQILVVAKYSPRLDALRFTIVQLVVVALASGAFTIVGERDQWERLVAWPVFGAAAFTGLLATTLALWVQTAAQRFTTAVHVTLIFSLEPVFGALAGRWLSGDQLSEGQLLGALLMIVGSLVAAVGPLLLPRHDAAA